MQWRNPRPCGTVPFWAGSTPKADSIRGEFILLLPQRSRQPGPEWAWGAVALTHPEVKHWMRRIVFSRICCVLPDGRLGINAQAGQCLGESLAMQHHCHYKKQLLWHCLDLGITQQNTCKCKMPFLESSALFYTLADMSHCCLLLIWPSGSNFSCFGDKQILPTS